MKMEDLRKQTVKELKGQLAKDQQKLSEFVVDIHTKEVKDVRKGRRLRKQIARIKTVIAQKEAQDA